MADRRHSGPVHFLRRRTMAAMGTSIRIEIDRKFVDQTGFVVHVRSVVERTSAWLNRNRRLAKDLEQTFRSAAASLHAASAVTLIRRLARYI